MKKKAGRKKLFENGATPLQEAVALLLGYGKRDKEVCEKLGVAYETIWVWRQHPLFVNLIEKYKNEFIERAKERGFDDIEFLNRTMVESLKSPAHRSDGIRARELLAKIRGELSGEKKEKEKVMAKKMSNAALQKILKAPVLNDSNISTNSEGGATKEAEREGAGKV